MIFEDYSFIENLSLKERERFFGSERKKKSEISLPRSNMMVNPLNLKHINRIDELPADMITLNLEDGVSESRKEEALYNIALFLSNLKESKSSVVVRVNPMDEGGEEEIRFLEDFGFDAVRISKVKSPEDIERALFLTSKDIHISMETKEAFANIGALKIDKRLTVANLGILDLLNSLSISQSVLSLDNPSIDYILSKFLIECKSFDIYPISFMYQDYKNIKEFKEWCLKEKRMGFGGKQCLGPLQVQEANKIFSVTEEDIKKARYIVEVFEKNSEKGINGFMDEKYGFIDEPIYKDALLILRLGV